MKTSSIQPKQNKLISQIQTKDSAAWTRIEQNMRFKLFHEMANRVPAYKDFLKKQGIKPGLIKSHKDLQNIPSMTKDNYLRKYSLKEKSWDGKLNDGLVLTSTSGSTGTPVYFTRNEALDRQSSAIHELYLNNAGFNVKEPTLVIVAFGMGVWIGGLITYQAFKYLEERGYPLSIITPGINKAEIMRILENVAPNYRQVLITGYPPFLKDVVDEMNHKKLKLKNTKLRLLFAAEPFSEAFRGHLSKEAGIAKPLLNTMNIYGSADIGTMAFETPLSIALRIEARKKQSLFNDLFSGIAKTPTLAQYVPNNISFESEDGKLLVTGKNAMPLFRYMIGDHGGRMTYNETVNVLQKHRCDPEQLCKRNAIGDYRYELPFVYVYERIDFSTTLYGLQVYPEPIREVLMSEPFNKSFSGKFAMVTQYNNKHDQYLEINFELQSGVSKISTALEKKLLNAIVKKLKVTNAEFTELHNYLGERALPKCVFWKAEDKTYFTPGVKQKWVLKK